MTAALVKKELWEARWRVSSTDSMTLNSISGNRRQVFRSLCRRLCRFSTVTLADGRAHWARAQPLDEDGSVGWRGVLGGLQVVDEFVQVGTPR